MTSAIFPTYFLARMIVSKPWALFAADRRGRDAGARLRAVPGRGAGRLPVGGALPLPDREGARRADALVGRSAPRRPALVAPARPRPARGADRRSTRSRRSSCCWTSAPAQGAGGGRGRRGTGSARSCSAIGAIIFFSAVVGAHSQTWFIATGFYRHRTIVYGLWAAGAFTIGLGVLPVVCAGGARSAARRAVDAGAEGVRRRSRAAALLAFGLYTATKASYLSTVVLDGRRRAEPDLPRAAAVRRHRARAGARTPALVGGARHGRVRAST